MKITKLAEYGYEEAVLGFSLSYNSSIERTKEILPKYAFGIPGESKFLEHISVWLDITAPRFWFQEFATYRVGTSTQSASTIHTLMKSKLDQSDFEYPIPLDYLTYINYEIDKYKELDKQEKLNQLVYVKSILPEGFLQRRITATNYKCLQNMYHQRKNHKLPQWSEIFCPYLLANLDHPEFIVKDYVK